MAQLLPLHTFRRSLKAKGLRPLKQINLTLMKLLLFILFVAFTGFAYGQANGYVAIQTPCGVVYAPRAGTPMYPVASPALNNIYGTGCAVYQPQRVYFGGQVPVYFNQWSGQHTWPGMYNTGGRAYGGSWNGYRRW